MYFSDRERGSKPRTVEVINERAWRGIAALIEGRIENASLGFGFSEVCPDNGQPIGTDRRRFSNILGAEIPDIEFPFETYETPDTLPILDLVEFVYRNVGKPENGSYHSFYQHFHLTFDGALGKEEFCSDVNRLFARQGLAYELTEGGLIVRTANTPTELALKGARFRTRDETLNQLLAKAQAHYFSPNPAAALDAVKELWDAWERLKTIIDPLNKKKSIASLISYAGQQVAFVEAIDSEAMTLTRIGNDFQIRHHEVGKTPLESASQVRYLFQRLFALIELLIPHLTGDSNEGQRV